MIANVASKWEDGKLIFYSKTSGNTIATFNPTTEKLDIAALQIDGADFGPAANQADSVAADVAGLVTDFNALLAKLQTAGLMASS